MKARILLVLAMVLVLVVASSASAAAGGAGVPFKGHYQTTCEMVGTDPDSGAWLFVIEGEGRATHLGKSAYDAESEIHVGEGPFHPYWSEVTLTAANGDQLFVTLEGFLSFPESMDPEGENEVYATFRITGGTGRFEGAGGTGDFWGWIEPTEELYYNGTLTK
jgi:hypothetical protein